MQLGEAPLGVWGLSTSPVTKSSPKITAKPLQACKLILMMPQKQRMIPLKPGIMSFRFVRLENTTDLWYIKANTGTNNVETQCFASPQSMSPHTELKHNKLHTCAKVCSFIWLNNWLSIRKCTKKNIAQLRTPNSVGRCKSRFFAQNPTLSMNKKYHHEITTILFNPIIQRIQIQTINCTPVQKVCNYFHVINWLSTQSCTIKDFAEKCAIHLYIW